MEDLDAMRHVDDGTGYKSTADATEVTTGCGGGDDNNSCFGYELVRDLDFNDNGSYSNALANNMKWRAGKGWAPVDFTPSNIAIFEGNGHTLSNLRIKSGEADFQAGLFSKIGGDGRVRNIGLLKVDLKAEGRDSNVGGLSGQNIGGRIINSYATGDVDGSAAGGLIGQTVGQGVALGTIRNSYAAVSVKGLTAGGLVGSLANHFITNNYATGDVAGSSNTGDVGGLVGSASVSNISKSYATGRVTGGNRGGLIGSKSGGSIIAKSYWDSRTSGIAQSAGGSPKTTVQLQSPIAPGSTTTEIYYGWSTSDWDFGTESEYPAVKYAEDTEADNLACGTSQQPHCGDEVPNQIRVFNRIRIRTKVFLEGPLR